MSKVLAAFWLFLATSAYAAEYKCHSFCGTPVIFSEMHILSSAQQPQMFSTGKSLEESFANLRKACEKASDKALPLRFLHAPTAANNSVKIVLVPALSGDVCAPSY